jgi:hypothetical protein
MFGFNIPAFNILDVLAMEWEYYPNPYMNSYHFIWKVNSPIPDFKTNTGIDTIQNGKQSMMMTGSGRYMHLKRLKISVSADKLQVTIHQEQTTFPKVNDYTERWSPARRTGISCCGADSFSNFNHHRGIKMKHYNLPGIFKIIPLILVINVTLSAQITNLLRKKVARR